MSNKGCMKEMSADEKPKGLAALGELAGKDDRAVIAQLFSFVEKLVEENRLLRERVEVLEEEVKVLRSQLNKNSHKSSKPPSRLSRSGSRSWRRELAAIPLHRACGGDQRCQRLTTMRIIISIIKRRCGDVAGSWRQEARVERR